MLSNNNVDKLIEWSKLDLYNPVFTGLNRRMVEIIYDYGARKIIDQDLQKELLDRVNGKMAERNKFADLEMALEDLRLQIRSTNLEFSNCPFESYLKARSYCQTFLSNKVSIKMFPLEKDISQYKKYYMEFVKLCIDRISNSSNMWLTYVTLKSFVCRAISHRLLNNIDIAPYIQCFEVAEDLILSIYNRVNISTEAMNSFGVSGSEITKNALEREAFLCYLRDSASILPFIDLKIKEMRTSNQSSIVTQLNGIRQTYVNIGDIEIWRPVVSYVFSELYDLPEYISFTREDVMKSKDFCNKVLNVSTDEKIRIIGMRSFRDCKVLTESAMEKKSTFPMPYTTLEQVVANTKWNAQIMWEYSVISEDTYFTIINSLENWRSVCIEYGF